MPSTYTLDVSGTCRVNGEFTCGTLNCGSIIAGGGIKSLQVYTNTTAGGVGRVMYATANGQFNTASSARDTKENIAPLDISASNVIYQFKPYTFTYIGDEKQKTCIGYMADEISEIDEKVTSYDENRKPDSVHYMQMVVYAIEEIKKLKTQNELLTSTINTLTETVSNLTETISKLK